jgi:hypothetical protein
MLVYRVEKSISDFKRLRSFVTSPPNTGCTTVVNNMVQRYKIEFPNSVSGELLLTSDLSRVE